MGVEGGPAVSEGLIDLGFDHIMFTGGPVVAKLVMARAARTLTPVTLELGGKNPCFVDEMNDDMLRAAVTEIIGTKVAFAGQFCQCHDVLLVVDSMWDKFVQALEAGITGLGDRRMVRTIHGGQFSRVKRMLDNHSGKAVPAVPEFSADELKFPVTAIVDAIKFANTIPTGKPLVSYYYGESGEHADQWA